MARLRDQYQKEIITALMEKYQYKSIMQVPKLLKIVVNRGVGAATGDKKLVDNSVDELTIIAGQKAVPTISKKAVSNFKLRENMNIGCMVTLRGDKMYEFMDRLMNIALPRVRDFKGVNDKGFDGRGNYTLGVKEQIIFPEISYDAIDTVRGMDVIVTTSANSDDEARELLKLFGFPFPVEEADEKAAA
ncbi:MAG: 50S ribosomal protein L5 [Alphaproteobacteria bacterium]|nr:MAG: 50S ribosomal protein L5 [Alphaproteobacteria bacterium]